jgi:perosamine synthetase
LFVLEDNAESLGGEFEGKRLGALGDAAVLSFFGNKIITSGEGGALLTDDEDLALLARELRDHGMRSDKKYHHFALGFNYRMTNLQAAVGLAQLERLNEILSRRSDQMIYYYQRIRSLDKFQLRKYADWCSPVHWLMTIFVEHPSKRDPLLEHLRKNNVEGRQMIMPVSLAAHFKERGYLPTKNSYAAASCGLHLPSGTPLSREQIDHVITALDSFEAK